jgi:hypothetical protein
MIAIVSTVPRTMRILLFIFPDFPSTFAGGQNPTHCTLKHAFERVIFRRVVKSGIPHEGLGT